MIEEKAIIVSADSHSAGAQSVQLQIVRDKPCGLCGKTQGCGISLFGQFAGHQNSTFSAHNGINAQIGDIVIVGVEDKALLTSALFLYGLPLFGLMFGAMAGTQLSSLLSHTSKLSDLYAAIGAVIGLVLMIVFAKVNAQTKNVSNNSQITILRIAF